MEPPPSVPLRRSTRNVKKVEVEKSQYEPDSFPDPRTRIQSPELLERLNDFLRDVGTDPDQIDINFPDLSCSINQARIFYEPRLEENVKIESTVLETKTEPAERSFQGDVKLESESLAPEITLDATDPERNFHSDDVKLETAQVSPEMISAAMDPEGNPKSAPSPPRMVLAVTEPEGNVHVGGNPELEALSPKMILDAAEIAENVEADVKPEAESSPPETIFAARNDQIINKDDFGPSVDSISPSKVVKVEDHQNEHQISEKPRSMHKRARNRFSNCTAM